MAKNNTKKRSNDTRSASSLELKHTILPAIAILVAVFAIMFWRWNWKPKPPMPMWSVKDIPGKAKGLVANVLIPKGTLLIRESPLVTLPNTIDITSAPQHIARAFDDLPSDTQTLFYTLANTTSHKFRPEQTPTREEILHNIFHTNAIISHSGSSSSLFPRISRINHSCRPNADFAFRDDVGELFLSPTKGITPGQEILTSYFDAGSKVWSERQEYLRAAYGFKCNCDACQQRGEALVESDRRRTVVAEAKRRIGAWSEGEGSTEEAVIALDQALRMLEEEQYASGLVELFVVGVILEASRKDRGRMRFWALRAGDRYDIELGPGSPHRTQMLAIAENPTLFPTWGHRSATFA